VKSSRKTGRPKDLYKGQARPFSASEVQRLEGILRADDSDTAVRDLALLRVGIDSALRSSDVLRLTLRDLAPNGAISPTFRVRQKKTGNPITCELLPKSIDALRAWLALNPAMMPGDRVFAICARQHNRIVHQWCRKLGLDVALYGTHSIRRTAPAHVYAHTKNIEVARQMLGHRSLGNTADYLNVRSEDVREAARKFPI
jgi:integrase